MRIIDGYKHRGLKYRDLLMLYGLDDLGIRRKRHHLAVMFRHSKMTDHLDKTRPEFILRNSNKLKFKIKTTQLTKVQNSPYYRGVSLWDHLPEDVQKATTKVKFKNHLAKLM